MATKTANIELMARTMTINFIKLSSSLYFPIISIRILITNNIEDQITKLFVKPNSFEAKPAVTIVTAA